MIQKSIKKEIKQLKQLKHIAYNCADYEKANEIQQGIKHLKKLGK